MKAEVIGLITMSEKEIAIYWQPSLFDPDLPLPDAVREMIVATLRQHADGLESRDSDDRMKAATRYFQAILNNRPSDA